MLRLALVLLFAGLVVGGRHTPFNNGNHDVTNHRNIYPIDYDDDLTISNPMVQPDSNIVFSFALNRYDQPPQVDVREEKLGKYMLRRKHSTTTSTTTPAPQLEDSEEQESDETVSLESAEEVLNIETLKPVAQPFMLGTGTTAKTIVRSFHDFSSPLELPDSKLINPAARYPPVNIWQARTLAPPRQPPSPEWDELKKLTSALHLSTKEPKEPQTEENISPIVVDEEISTSTTASPPTSILTDITPEPVKRRSNRHRDPHHSRHSNRGIHKFSWDDLKLDAPAALTAPAAHDSPALTVSTSAPTPPRIGPPPPVPTLSPWVGDNLGKR